MTLKTRLKVESSAVLLFSIFYVVVGLVEILFLATTSFIGPPHLGVLGILSLVTAYGLFRMRRWSVPLVTALFFLGMTFGSTTLYDSIRLQTFEGALLFHSALIIYLILTLVAFIYVAAKRKNFE